MNTFIEEQNRQRGATAHREGRIARSIEDRTARLPSDVFLWAAGVSVLASLALEVFGMTKNRTIGRYVFGREPQRTMPLAGFVGMWVPSLLLLGVYNKIVKVAGSDRTEMSSI